MSYNAVLMEMVNEGPHHMSPFMLLLHAWAREYSRNDPKLIAVELGTNHGNSTVAIAAGLASSGAGHLHTCDVIDCAGAQQMLYRAGVAPFVTLYQEDSLTFANRFKDDSVGFLFLDTSHERDDTVKELRAWAPKVKPRAHMVLHDTCSRPFGVRDPMWEFATSMKWPCYDIAVDCGIGVLTKP